MEVRALRSVGVDRDLVDDMSRGVEHHAVDRDGHATPAGQPPKISPAGLVSEDIARVRMTGLFPAFVSKGHQIARPKAAFGSAQNLNVYVPDPCEQPHRSGRPSGLGFHQDRRFIYDLMPTHALGGCPWQYLESH